jgi:hypothetical protein
MSDLAGAVPRPPVWVSIQEQRSAHAGANRHEQEIPAIPGSAKAALSQGMQTQIVVDGYRQGESLLQALAQGIILRFRQVGGKADHTGSRVDQSRHGNAAGLRLEVLIFVRQLP